MRTFAQQRAHERQERVKWLKSVSGSYPTLLAAAEALGVDRGALSRMYANYGLKHGWEEAKRGPSKTSKRRILTATPQGANF